MQLLFDRSSEGIGAGLGIFAGGVTRLNARRVPHMGWNSVDDAEPAVLGDSGLVTAYYANSYACRPEDTSTVVAWSTHDGDRFPAIVRRGAVTGIQFHPEKSGPAGVRWLRALVTASAERVCA
jgi:glutamine amidotransferase